MSVKYLVYILRTNKDTLYTGVTNNLKKRLEKHRTGKGSKYLRSFETFELVYKEEFGTRSGAMIREYEIKQWTKDKKEKLILS